MDILKKIQRFDINILNNLQEMIRHNNEIITIGILSYMPYSVPRSICNLLPGTDHVFVGSFANALTCM